jgi:hypothetical protein
VSYLWESSGAYQTYGVSGHRHDDAIMGMTWRYVRLEHPQRGWAYKRKWGRVPFDQMLRHIREDKCEQCREGGSLFYREAELEIFLRTQIKRTPSAWAACLLYQAANGKTVQRDGEGVSCAES